MGLKRVTGTQSRNVLNISNQKLGLPATTCQRLSANYNSRSIRAHLTFLYRENSNIHENAYEKIRTKCLFYCFMVAFIALALHTGLAVSNWWLALLCVPVAMYVADAMTGLVHFYCDYVPCKPGRGLRELFFYEGDRSSPTYNQLKAKVMKQVSALEEVMFDFKVHHPRPMAMARRTTIHLLLTGVLFIGSPFLLCFFVLKLLGVPADLQFIVLMTAFCMMFVQFSHACAHQHNESTVIRFLQKTRIFIPPEIHDHHHVVLDRDFAILNGWSNPLVNVLVRYCFQKGWVNEAGLTPE